MEPTLKEDQEVLVFNWAYIFSKPKIGDMVVVKVNGQEIVKRIQKIDGRLVFVTGDNTKDSFDSRKLGLINLENIVGKIIWYQ